MVRETGTTGQGTSSSQTYLETLGISAEDLDNYSTEGFRDLVEIHVTGETQEEVNEQITPILADLETAQQKIEELIRQIERATSRRNQGAAAIGQELVTHLNNLIAEIEAAEGIVRQVKDDFIPHEIDVRADRILTEDDLRFSATEPEVFTVTVAGRITNDPFTDIVDPNQSVEEYLRAESFTDAQGVGLAKADEFGDGDGTVTGRDIDMILEARERTIRSQRNTVTLDLKPGDHLSLVPGSNPPKFKWERADGTSAYVTINGDCNIDIVNGLTTADEDILPAWGNDLLKRTYVNGRSLYESMEGEGRTAVDPKKEDKTTKYGKKADKGSASGPVGNGSGARSDLSVMEGYDEGRLAFDEIEAIFEEDPSKRFARDNISEREFQEVWDAVFQAVNNGDDIQDALERVLQKYNSTPGKKADLVSALVIAMGKYGPDYFDAAIVRQIGYLEGVLANGHSTQEPNGITKLAYLLLETKSTFPGSLGGMNILSTMFATDPEIDPTEGQWAQTESNIWALEKLAELNPTVAVQSGQVRRALEDRGDDGRNDDGNNLLKGEQYGAMLRAAHRYALDVNYEDVSSREIEPFIVDFIRGLYEGDFSSLDDMREYILQYIISAVKPTYRDNLASVIVMALHEYAPQLFADLCDGTKGKTFAAQMLAYVREGGDKDTDEELRAVSYLSFSQYTHDR